MKDIGTAKYCLGIAINQMDDQIHYIASVLKKFGMDECKATKTPSELNSKLTKSMVNETNTIVNRVPYQEAVDCLLYIANATRPDICHATSNVSRFNNDHSEQHWLAVKRILRYLRGTINMKLRFRRNHSKEMINAFC